MIDSVTIRHACGHEGFVSPRLAEDRRAIVTARSCPGCAPDGEQITEAFCRRCGRYALRLLSLLEAKAPTAQSLAGVQVKTAARAVRWLVCGHCFRWSRER